MDRTLKVVLADTWLKPALARDDLEIVGLVDLNEDAAVSKNKQYNLEAVTGSDLATILKETGAEAVFDCSIPKAHTGVTLTAMEHGCHVLGEKPMSDTMGKARSMVEAANRTGRIYAVIQNRRYLPGIRAVRDFLAAGSLGAITTVQSNFFMGAHFGGFRNVMEHVLILDMAIHTFDAARFILGSDRIDSHLYSDLSLAFVTSPAVDFILYLVNIEDGYRTVCEAHTARCA